MEDTTSHPFADLKWHRLKATLLNIRMVPGASAHPLSVMQAIIKGVTTSLGQDEPPIFFHILDKKHTYRMRERDSLALEIFFCRTVIEYANKWRQAFQDYLADAGSGKNFDITTLGDVEERNYGMVAAVYEARETRGELCLEFLSPFPFRRDKEKHRTFLSKDVFIRSFEDRISKLFERRIAYRAADDAFSVIPYYWNYTEVKHDSKSQPGHTKFINGCAGKLYLKGEFRAFLPYLILGAELHTGPELTYGRGHYLFHPQAPVHFDRFFPNKKAIMSVTREVIERYDNALEALSMDGNFPFDEDKHAEDLSRLLAEKTFTPAPNVAFTIKKKSGSERMVEQVPFRELIIAHYVYRTISETIERMLENTSIGFRKGISRQRAVDLVRSAVDAGYQYVIESDIEDFFPSVDLRILTELLEYYLPETDLRLKNALYTILRTGYVLNGRYHERTKGLAQGNPLSPLLANLYLDSFDEKTRDWNVRMIRYADDFVILARSREDAESVLTKTETCLSELGLKINKTKTEIRHVKEGFRFLGMSFDRTEAADDHEEIIKRMKKPLYVTEPYHFLALNGEAVDIKKGGALVQTIPLRRISEIMVMERSVFSTALVKKCTDYDIPMTLLLNSGYYITTIKPDSKQYYDISYEHARRYCALTETERLCFAKEFAAAKLANYVSLFKQRDFGDQKLLFAELERAIRLIHGAATVDQARGYEGAAAKKIFQGLNGFIKDASFHIKKRIKKGDREKPDRINALLNFGYYLLFSRINATIRAVGLNPYLGFLHSPENNYESLVCDIQELFRARVDRFIIRLINLKMIKADDFVESERGMHLTREGVRKYLAEFEKEMERKQGPNVLSLKESIYVQTMVIKNFVLENKPPSFYTWTV